MPRPTRRIGVISDTHGLVRPEALEALANVDHILHAGDIGGDHVLDALRAIAPVTAVRGNVDIDMPPPSVAHPTTVWPGYDIVRTTVDGLRILLTHILPSPAAPSEEVRASLMRDGADVVVFGHSHLPHDEKSDGVWFVNPASAGPRRFDYPVSVAILERTASGWIACHVPLDSRSVTAIGDRMNQLR